ncbi:ComEC/Rec2 family competence protein [Algibacter sp. L4_22]|uniref:ComEC/Rec2 family competence protein n=1 Tax=Algibacter sp. L4_22 TaxID=2942477 RepID=UPI00201B467E|nr:ComEC/Rec2 family competence protein [Algibacter sp. L4_22]MCL5130081.1 ComEC family competence protein [Algibacter sp. L4_22]
MKIFNFTIIKLTICLVLGILIGYFFFIPLPTVLYFLLAVLLLLVIAYFVARKQFFKTIWFGLLAFMLMTIVGVLTVNIHNEKSFDKHYTQHILNEKETTNTITFRIREVLKPNAYYDKYVIDILQVNAQQTIGKSLLNIKKDSLQLALRVDAVFSTKSSFQDLGYPLNPYQFDYQNYLEKKYIYHQLSLKQSELFPISNDTHTLFGYANSIRESINLKLKRYHFKPDELAVINALFLGQRQDLSKEVYNDYKNAGAIHILAISGLHIGIILILLSWVFKPIERLKHGKLLKTILLLFLLWNFAVIAGLSASITRAVTMFSIVTIAANLKRPTNIYNTLAISVFLILLFKPLFIFDVGFQLSYMAVFAIVTIDPILYKLWQPQNKLVDIYWHTITVSIAAQFGIAPLLLYYFHQFAGLFLLSNIIIIPLLAIILGFGIVIILMASLNLLPQFLADILGLIISSMNYVMNYISKQEVFIFNDIPFNIWYVLASYLLIISLIKTFKKWNYANLKWILFAIISIQCAFIYTNYSKSSNELIVFHKSRFSMIGNTNKNTLKITHDLDSLSILKNSTIKNYTVGNFINTIENAELQSVYVLKNKKILLVVDSLNTYNIKSFEPDYLLLRQSPKINLNRLIDSIHPKYIIADGSNYKSYVLQWKNICKKRKLPFHDTHEKGAFVIKY